MDNIKIAKEFFHQIGPINGIFSLQYITVYLGHFLQYVLRSWGLNQVIHRIWTSISSVSYRVTANGISSGIFYPKRRLRQGDPKSPYLYLIAGEALSKAMKNLENKRKFLLPQLASGSERGLLFNMQMMC